MQGLTRNRSPGPNRAAWLATTVIVAFAASLPLKLPALSAPFDLDELLVLGGIDGTTPWMGSRLDLYQFSNGEKQDVESLIHQGALPWFTSSGWKYALWRPLTSVTLNVDHALFGDDRLGYQLHSLLWWLALILIFAVLMFSLFGNRVTFWAVLAFSVSAVHGEAVIWLSARHTLVATTLGVAGIAAHVHWRETSASSVWRLVSALCFLGALVASESGLQCLAYLVAYEVLRGVSFRRRPRFALRPELAIAAGYLILYRLFERGTGEALEYINALSEPAAFVDVAACRGSVLLGRLTTTFDLGSWTAVGLFLVAAGVLALRTSLPPVPRRHADWLIVGSLFSIVPSLCGFPEDRALLAPSVGWSAFLGCAIERTLRRMGEGGVGRSRAKLLVVVLGTLVVLHLGRAPLVAHARCLDHVSRARSEVEAVRAVSSFPREPRRVICLNSPNWLIGQVGDSLLRARRGETPRWWLLSMTQAEHRLTRTGPGRFELSSIEIAFDVHYFRDPGRHPIWPGLEVDQTGLRIRVLDSSHGWPTRIEVNLDGCLDDPTTALVTLVRGQLRKMEPPAIGESIRIPAPKGL